MENGAQMTPEMYAALMAQQGAEGGQEPAAGDQAPQDGGAPLTPEQVAQIMAAQQGGSPAQPQQPTTTAQPEQPTQDAGDPVAEAKELLGLTQQEQMLAQMQAQLKAMEIEKTQAQLKAKYPNVPDDAVKAEIEKVKETNPQLADEMMSTPVGLEMAYRAALASMQPAGTPDNLTHGEGGGGDGGDEGVEEKIKTGKASDFDLGNYILGLKG